MKLTDEEVLERLREIRAKVLDMSLDIDDSRLRATDNQLMNLIADYDLARSPSR